MHAQYGTTFTSTIFCDGTDTSSYNKPTVPYSEMISCQQAV